MKRIYFIKGLKISNLDVTYLIFKNLYDLSKENRVLPDYIINIKRNIRIIRFKNLIHSVGDFFFKNDSQPDWSGIKKISKSSLSPSPRGLPSYQRSSLLSTFYDHR